MARIAGVNIPTAKRVPIALQYIHGIGAFFAEQVCEALNIDRSRAGKVIRESETRLKAIQASYEVLSGLKQLEVVSF